MTKSYYTPVTGIANLTVADQLIWDDLPENVKAIARAFVTEELVSSEDFVPMDDHQEVLNKLDAARADRDEYRDTIDDLESQVKNLEADIEAYKTQLKDLRKK